MLHRKPAPGGHRRCPAGRRRGRHGRPAVTGGSVPVIQEPCETFRSWPGGVGGQPGRARPPSGGADRSDGG